MDMIADILCRVFPSPPGNRSVTVLSVSICTLFLAICALDVEGEDHLKKPPYRSEAILEVEEMGGRTEEEREALLSNLEDRLRDWSVLGNAMARIGDDAELRRKTIRDAVSAELIDDDRMTVRFEYEDPVICHAILSALIERIASEGIEDGGSERIAFIRARLEEAGVRLLEAEKRLDDFEKEHGALLTEEKMVGEIARDKILISNCRMDAAAARARKSALEKRLRTTPKHIVASTVLEYGPEVLKLKRALTAKEEKLDSVRAKRGEGPKAARLEEQISELKLQLAAVEEGSTRQETRSLNPVYQGIEEEMLEAEEMIASLEDEIGKSEERAERNKRAIREAAGFQRERKKLERSRDDGRILIEALQKKLEKERVEEMREGGVLEVEILVPPTEPALEPPEETGAPRGERRS